MPRLRSNSRQFEHASSARPHIEVMAQITRMNNFSVRWYPAGWCEGDFDRSWTDQNSLNLIPQRTWPKPPDFLWFEGDESPTFERRPSNELMYIRGVGNLRPEPRGVSGTYFKYNADVVDSVLFCAVRAAYEGLIRQLELSFRVDALNAFGFVVREEPDETDHSFYGIPIRRVVGWSIERDVELQAR